MSRRMMAITLMLLCTSMALAETSEDCVQHHDLDLQISACTAMIDRGGKLAWAYNNRGNAYYDKGDNYRAIGDYDKAIALDSKYAFAYRNRGNAYYDNGDTDRAMADYDKAVALDNKYASAYMDRGNAYVAKGDISRAIADYDQAIALNPNDGIRIRSRGMAKFGNSDFKGAIADFLRSIELQDDATAMIYRYLARVRDGESATSASLELQTNASRLKNGAWPQPMIELYLGKGRPEEILDRAGKAGNRCTAWFYIGQWYITQNRLVDAVAALTSAVNSCPKSYTTYGLVLAELKRLMP